MKGQRERLRYERKIIMREKERGKGVKEIEEEET